jgi:4'-phosphopantetheinyl transferase
MSQEWVVTEAIAPLEPGVIDLYGTKMEEHFDRLDLLFASLSEEEQVRAKRYRYPKDYNQFVVARGLLRRLLGKYLGLDPSAVAFTYGSHGKPIVEGLEFNLAHSGGWVLFGISGDRAIGVDIERMQAMETDLDRLSSRTFTKAEAQVVKNLAATGDGLGKMKSLDVVCPVDQAAQLVNPQGWDLQELLLEETLVGAVCAVGVDWRSRFWRLELGF